jgi:hypothetical protein
MAINPNTDFTTGQVLLASEQNRFPRGVMLFGTKTTSSTGSTLNTEQTIVTGTFTAVANRLYRMTYFEPELTASASSGSAAYMRILDGATQLQAIYAGIDSGQYVGQIITVTTTLTAGSHTINATLIRAAPITLNADRASNKPAVLTVEDIGGA